MVRSGSHKFEIHPLYLGAAGSVLILHVSCRLPFWKLLTNVDSGPKVERELRTFSNRLRRHQLVEGVISLNEHSTSLLSDMVCASLCCTASITNLKSFSSLEHF